MNSTKTIVLAAICTAGISATAAFAEGGKDSGYLFSNPHVAEETLELSTGKLLEANHQKSVSISDNPDSPWHMALFLAQGTTIKTLDGNVLQDVALLQFIDKDGDITWGYIDWTYEDGPAEFYIMGGTGKWEGIVGKGRTTGMVMNRADGFPMPRWEMEWEIVEDAVPNTTPFEY